MKSRDSWVFQADTVQGKCLVLVKNCPDVSSGWIKADSVLLSAGTPRDGGLLTIRNDEDFCTDGIPEGPVSESDIALMQERHNEDYRRRLEKYGNPYHQEN